DRDSGMRAELPRPHAGAVHHDVGANLTLRRAHAAHPPTRLQHIGDGDALDDPDAPLPCAFGERHGDVHRVHATVLAHVEAGLDVIDPREREELLHLAWSDLVHVDAAIAV